MGTSTTSYW